MISTIKSLIRPLVPLRLRRWIKDARAASNSLPPPAVSRGNEDSLSIGSSLRYLRSWGFSPTAAVDVGAYHGEWTQLFKDIFPESSVLMFEPQSSKSGILRNLTKKYPGKVSLECALLGAENGKKVRFVEMETGSSVFEEKSSFERTYTEVRTQTLDSVLASEKYPEFRRVDFLKLDVQGYELEVLRGASAVLQRTEFVLLEAALIPINTGCPLIADVIVFMKESNFRLLDFCSQIRRRDGALWQTDLLFVRNDSSFVPRAELTKDNWG